MGRRSETVSTVSLMRVGCALGKAVETALVLLPPYTGLKPGANEKLQKTEMRPVDCKAAFQGEVNRQHWNSSDVAS